MGGLFYPNELVRPLIGTKSGTTRTSATLTGAYTGNTKTFETANFSELCLEILYTTGSGETNNSIEIKVEESPDGTNFYQLTNEAASAGTSTLTQREFTFVGASAATAYAFSYRLDVTYKYIKISAKESGVVTNAGTAYIESTLGGL